MKTFILICAAPGQGKSTIANALLLYWWRNEDISASVHEADDYMIEDGKYKFNPKKLGFAHKSCFDACELDMAHGVNLVIQSNTNLYKKHRQPYLDLARKYDYKVQEIFIRGDSFGSVHGVPPEKVAEMEKALEI